MRNECALAALICAPNELARQQQQQQQRQSPNLI